jgi:SulP family sulfate permease
LDKPMFDIVRPVPADLIAGLSVALVLIPQSLAYAQIAELPVVAGLFASAIPLMVFALFASSPYLQTGPVALTSLLTLAALQGAGFATDHPDYVSLAALLALVVGLCRLTLGLARLGWVAYLIAEPVRKGFTSAAALIIISSQLPKVLGTDDATPDRSTIGRALWSLANPGQWNGWAIVVAITTLAVMLGGRRLHRLFPGVAVAVVAGLGFAAVASGRVATVGATNPIPEGLPSLSLSLPWSQLAPLAVGGLVIALVGFAEPASIARQFAQEDKTAWDANRELFASGAANLAAAASGAFPVGGSFSRSSINRLAGAKTRWSGGVTGLVVLAFLPFASVLDQLPTSVLGAIVIGAVLSLVGPVKLVRLWQHSPLEAGLAWFTFAATLLVAPAVQWAVLAGVALTALTHLIKPLRLTISTDSTDAGSERLVVEPDGLLWMGSARTFERQLRAVVDDHPDADIELDMGPDPCLDPTTEAAIANVSADAERAGRSLLTPGLD